MGLSREQARQYYNRFGAKQDKQSFYEAIAFQALIQAGCFGAATAVVELGCGTSRLAYDLINHHLPETATYIGYDLSSTMVQLSRQRLAAFSDRAQVFQSDGSLQFDLATASIDRFIATYVFDLLSEVDIQAALTEAHRLLKPEGYLCIANLSYTSRFWPSVVVALWKQVYRLQPSLVGGCHPFRLLEVLPLQEWKICYRTVVVAAGIPSEVAIAQKIGS